MKCKKYLIPLSILFIPFILNSQIIDEYGVKLAFTQSKVDPKEEAYQTSWRSGLNVGFFAEKGVYKMIHAVIQLEYASKGYRFKSIEMDEYGNRIQTVWANTRLDYVSMPLFLKIINNNSKYRPFIQVGPRLDYLFNFKRGIFKFSEVEVRDEMPSLLYLNSFSVGSSLSLGCYLSIMDSEKLLIEVRYNSDFSDIPSESNVFFGKGISYDFWLGYSF